MNKAKLLLLLRKEGVTDSRILSAFESIPREIFVDEPFKNHAYENVSLPINCGQTISQPSVIAIMTRALDLGARMKVLEIGTGSGYQAAILARLCRRVYTVERHRTLSIEAAKKFHELTIHNVSTKVDDGYFGWPAQAPFQRILVTAASTEPPPRLLEQLGDNGVMVIPIGSANSEQKLYRLQREGEKIIEDFLAEVRFVPLVKGGVSETKEE